MTCLSGYPKTSKACSQYADQGYNTCSQTADKGYNSCQSKYYNKCHWYSPWNCIAGWFCSAWTWISNVVCVAWTWVSNVVCIAWNIATTFVCLVWDVVTTIVNAVLVTIESVLSPILNAIASLIQFLFAIPIVGRFLSWLWNIATAAVSAVVGAADAVGGLIGIRPEKRLVLLVLNQLDEQRQPIATDADLMASISRMIQVYRDEANIRVLPVRLFNYRTPFPTLSQLRKITSLLYLRPGRRTGSTSVAGEQTPRRIWASKARISRIFSPCPDFGRIGAG